MPEAIKWRSTIALGKLETTYGTDSAPTGGANALLMTNVTLAPMEGDDVSRELERPYMGNQSALAGSLRVTLTGTTELAGSGTAGTPPAWGVLARVCGFAETISAGVSVIYSPITDGNESATFHFWKGGTRHVLTGARGTGVVNINAQGIPNISWTITGLFNAPGEVARPTVDLSSFIAPLLASNTNTPDFSINSVDLVLKSYSLDLGNQVAPRLLIGREEIKIGDKFESLSANVEAVPLTTLNPYALAIAKTQVPVTIKHGTVAGSIITIAAPKCEMQRVPSSENDEGVTHWPLSLKPIPSAGNDQLTMALT